MPSAIIFTPNTSFTTILISLAVILYCLISFCLDSVIVLPWTFKTNFINFFLSFCSHVFQSSPAAALLAI